MNGTWFCALLLPIAFVLWLVKLYENESIMKSIKFVKGFRRNFRIDFRRRAQKLAFQHRSFANTSTPDAKATTELEVADALAEAEVVGVTNAPTLVYFCVTTPLKGARIIVFSRFTMAVSKSSRGSRPSSG